MVKIFSKNKLLEFYWKFHFVVIFKKKLKETKWLPLVFLFLCLSWFSSEKFLYINNEKAILNYRQRRLRLYNSGTKFVPFVKFLQKNLFSFTKDFVVLYAEHQWIGLLSRWSFPYNLSVEKQDLKRFGLVWFSLVWFKLEAWSFKLKLLGIVYQPKKSIEEF